MVHDISGTSRYNVPLLVDLLGPQTHILLTYAELYTFHTPLFFTIMPNLGDEITEDFPNAQVALLSKTHKRTSTYAARRSGEHNRIGCLLSVPVVRNLAPVNWSVMFSRIL